MASRLAVVIVGLQRPGWSKNARLRVAGAIGRAVALGAAAKADCRASAPLGQRPDCPRRADGSRSTKWPAPISTRATNPGQPTQQAAMCVRCATVAGRLTKPATSNSSPSPLPGHYGSQRIGAGGEVQLVSVQACRRPASPGSSLRSMSTRLTENRGLGGGDIVISRRCSAAEASRADFLPGLPAGHEYHSVDQQVGHPGWRQPGGRGVDSRTSSPMTPTDAHARLASLLEYLAAVPPAAPPPA